MTHPLFAVRLTEAARDDLRGIFESVAERHSSADAANLIARMIDKADELTRFAQRGAVPKELAALGIRGFRQVLLRPYRIIYSVHGDSVIIHLVADGRRDMQSLLKRRLLRS